MEWVVTQQLHSRKILDKKLNEINASQRQSEARLDRQLRELGLDLTKIKHSSADLDDLHDLTPRPSGRRGSLPQIAGETTSLKSPGASSSPRSRRRLSIASIPVTPRNGHHTGSSVNGVEHQKSQRRGSIPNIATSIGDQQQAAKNTKTCNGSLSSSKTKTNDEQNEHTNGTAASKKSLPNIDKELKKDAENSQVQRKNATAIFVHQENGGIKIDDEILEAEARHAMGARGRTRRSSEPAISVDFLHYGQLVGPDAGLHNGGDKSEFRLSIQQHLPSNMVAEEDEEADARDDDCSDETNKFRQADTGGKPNAVQSTGKAMKKKTSVASEKDRKAEKIKTEGSLGQGYSRQRRKSEGDILRFAQIWTRQQETTRNGRVKGQGSNNGYSYGVRNSSDDVWDSVRKCRYIRGYDPPEMIEPDDPSEYVFGHK